MTVINIHNAYFKYKAFSNLEPKIQLCCMFCTIFRASNFCFLTQHNLLFFVVKKQCVFCPVVSILVYYLQYLMIPIHARLLKLNQNKPQILSPPIYPNTLTIGLD